MNGWQHLNIKWFAISCFKKSAWFKIWKMCSISMYVRLSRQNQRGVTRCKMNGRFIQLWDSNFEPGLCLTRWGAVGDGLIYFSENCHSGIIFGLACAVFLHLFTVVAIMFNLGVFCSDTYKVTLIKIRMFKKLPCLARVFWSFKNCDALICCDPCLPIGSPPLLPDPLLQAKCDWDKSYFLWRQRQVSAPTQVQSLYIRVSQQVVDNKKGKGQPEGILLSFECKLFIFLCRAQDCSHGELCSGGW